MGKITDQQQWEEDIYLIEKQDKVLGGELGVINIQAKQLANRTKYLKGQVDTINQDRTGYAPKASPAFTGIPTAPTAAAGTNNAQIATTEFVKTAIAALVGSAPAALDTLEELARALAGDANLKSTLLAEIGKKANAYAREIKKALQDAGRPLCGDYPTNQVFFLFSHEKMTKLKIPAQYAYLERYDENSSVIRFCTSWSTREADVKKCCEIIRSL